MPIFSSAKQLTLIKVTILGIFLIISNPTSVELKSKAFQLLKFSFVKGISKFLSIKFREAFSNESDIVHNRIFFSYYTVDSGAIYFGIGGFWISPNFGHQSVAG